MNVLYIVHRFPFPPDKGCRIRTFHMAQYLGQRCRLSVATLADERVSPDHLSQMRAYCRRLAVAHPPKPLRYARGLASLALGGTCSEGVFDSGTLRRAIARWSRKNPFDRVVLSASSLVPYLAMPELCRVPAIVDMIDVDSEKWRSYAEQARGPRRWLYAREAIRLRRVECHLPASVTAVSFISRPECELYTRVRQECGGAADASEGAPDVHAISNGVDTTYFAPQADPGTPSCVFVGAMDYLPNVDAATWFCQNVWPEVVRRRPQARFAIVGRDPTPAVRRLAEIPGVSVTGSVPDVRPYVREASVVVAPLRIARGIQNKVLEAMAMGRPVVASPEALFGLEAGDDREVLQAVDVPSWIGHVDRLLDDQALRQRIGRTARGFVERNHDWAACLAPLSTLLEASLPAGACQTPARGGHAMPTATHRQPVVG